MQTLVPMVSNAQNFTYIFNEIAIKNNGHHTSALVTVSPCTSYSFVCDEALSVVSSSPQPPFFSRFVSSPPLVSLRYLDKDNLLTHPSTFRVSMAAQVSMRANANI